MTTTLDAIAALPVPQRHKNMAAQLWAYIHANEPRMPEPHVTTLEKGHVDFHWHRTEAKVCTSVPGKDGGYYLWSEGQINAGQGISYQDNTFAIVDLLRVCQRFVQATAREVR